MSLLKTLRPTLPILIGASVMLTFSMGFRQSLGIFLQPLTHDIHISVADFTLAIAMQNLAWGFLQPLAGAMTVRYGFRPIMMVGALLYIAGLALLAPGVAAVILGLAFGGFSLRLSGAAFGWLLLLSFSSQTVGWLLITSSLPRLPAAVSSLLLLLQPAGSLLLADVILGERPALLQVAGAAGVCGGILAANGALSGVRRLGRGPARPAPEGPLSP